MRSPSGEQPPSPALSGELQTTMNECINAARLSARVRYIALLCFACLFAVSVGGELRGGAQARASEQKLITEETVGKDVEGPARQIVHLIRRIKPKTGATAIAWSPDGKRLAVLGGLQQRITMWDPRTGDLLWEVVGDGAIGQALAFSNDDRLLLAPAGMARSENRPATLTIWDVATGSGSGSVPGPFPNEGPSANFARKIALDRQSGLMVVIAAQHPGRPVGIYAMADWTLKGKALVERDTPEAIALGHDGALAIGTARGKIALFDARTQTIRRVIDVGHAIDSLTFSPDGKYIACGVDELSEPIKVWNTADGALVRSFAGEFSVVKGLAWSPDGRYIASASFDRTLRLWAFSSGGRDQIVANFKGGAWTVAFSPDGAFLAGGSSEDDVVIAEIR